MIAAPSSWPRTWSGFSALPTSETVTWRTMVMSPVSSVDLDLDGRAVELEEGGASRRAGGPGSASLRISPMPMTSPPSRPEPADQDVADGQDALADAGPRRDRRRPSASSTDSSRAAIARSLAWTSRQASRTALPMSTDERLAEVCWS